jgi:hypothetical protein
MDCSRKVSNNLAGGIEFLFKKNKVECELWRNGRRDHEDVSLRFGGIF